jgi:hypothetical protein
VLGLRRVEFLDLFMLPIKGGPLAQVIIKKAFRCSSEARLHKRCMLEAEEKKERFSMNTTLAALLTTSAAS